MSVYYAFGTCVSARGLMLYVVCNLLHQPIINVRERMLDALLTITPARFHSVLQHMVACNLRSSSLGADSLFLGLPLVQAPSNLKIILEVIGNEHASA